VKQHKRFVAFILFYIRRVEVRTSEIEQSKYVGTSHSRAKIYAARASYAADNAHRPPLRGFAAAAHFAAALGATDGWTDTAPF